jgi:hypothetical protein
MLREHRTNAIARNESDANAKKKQERLIHVRPLAYLKLRDLTEDLVYQVAGGPGRFRDRREARPKYARAREALWISMPSKSKRNS